jgi:hypothetical protein
MKMESVMSVEKAMASSTCLKLASPLQSRLANPAKAGKSGHPNQTATDSQQVGTYVLNLVFELLLRMCLEYVHSIFLFMDGAFLGARDGGLVFGYTTYYVLLCFLAKWSVFLSLKSLSSFVWRTSELRSLTGHFEDLFQKESRKKHL